MQVENMDTIQGLSHGEKIDDEKKEEAVIQDDKDKEPAEVKEGGVAKKDDEEKNLTEEEKKYHKILMEEEIKNTNLKQKVKFYMDEIAKLNKKNDGLDEIQNKLKELTEQYFDLESRIHEVRFFSII